ncbi:MAG TPA: Hsp20/alpha crystallin family protein [Candidatus Paceibacterota bacterium]|jgi:HSP20 family protein
MKKRSFFDRLSGSAPIDDYDAFDDDVAPAYGVRRGVTGTSSAPSAVAVNTYAAHEPDTAEGQLPVDVYQTENEIVVRAFVAGVRPDDINLSISRDMVVIDGVREERDQVLDHDYIKRELFWGSFSTTILLPQEIDVDNATASAKDGLLTLALPRLDKSRQTKLKVKAG